MLCRRATPAATERITSSLQRATIAALRTRALQPWPRSRDAPGPKHMGSGWRQRYPPDNSVGCWDSPPPDRGWYLFLRKRCRASAYGSRCLEERDPRSADARRSGQFRVTATGERRGQSAAGSFCVRAAYSSGSKSPLSRRCARAPFPTASVRGRRAGGCRATHGASGVRYACSGASGGAPFDPAAIRELRGRCPDFAVAARLVCAPAGVPAEEKRARPPPDSRIFTPGCGTHSSPAASKARGSRRAAEGSLRVLDSRGTTSKSGRASTPRRMLDRRERTPTLTRSEIGARLKVVDPPNRRFAPNATITSPGSPEPGLLLRTARKARRLPLYARRFPNGSWKKRVHLLRAIGTLWPASSQWRSRRTRPSHESNAMPTKLGPMLTAMRRKRVPARA